MHPPGIKDDSIPPFAIYLTSATISSSDLRQYFAKSLLKKGVTNKSDWKKRALTEFTYDNAKSICRFALFVSAHDTIADQENIGLMKKGTKGINPYLDFEHWTSPALAHIEHVAPDSPKVNTGWEKAIYDDFLKDNIGNLTLLPAQINISASNKGWLDKYFYYKHLANNDPGNLAALQNEAGIQGVTLLPETLELLQNAEYSSHIHPITELGIDGKWDSDFIRKRADRICDILWDKIAPWLDLQG